MPISQKVKGVIMRNLRGTIFYMKANVLQDFPICISVPLSISFGKDEKEYPSDSVFSVQETCKLF